MLELSTFQIFFMVLHGALLVFLMAFLSRGASQKRDNVVQLSDAKRKRRKRKKKKAVVPKPAPNFAHPSAPAPAPAARAVRDVREVREIRELIEARSANSSPDMVRYSLAPGERKTS